MTYAKKLKEMEAELAFARERQEREERPPRDGKVKR